MVFKMMCFKVFSKFPIGFNGFQNDVFQSVFKMVSMVFKMMCSKVFSKWFEWFSKLCVSKCFQNGFNGFQNYVLQSVFKLPHRFQCFSKMMCFKSVFRIPDRFQWFSK